MPLQNRVSPRSEIIAHPSRQGQRMGNRGCLHNARQQIVRAYYGDRWIICLLEFNGKRQPLMEPGCNTQLFFLDEAVGLAAGHRPCGTCQHDQFEAFIHHWAAANPELAGSLKPKREILDAALHRERGVQGGVAITFLKASFKALLGEMPDGTYVVLTEGDRPYLVLGDRLYPWSFEGYGTPIPRPSDIEVEVLTPPSTIRALAHGYRPFIHPSASPTS